MKRLDIEVLKEARAALMFALQEQSFPIEARKNVHAGTSDEEIAANVSDRALEASIDYRNKLKAINEIDIALMHFS